MAASPKAELIDLEERLGHYFGRPRLLAEALTHTSFAYENRDSGRPHNERLEFLGDAVLELAVTRRLHRLLPRADEGRLTGLRAGLVNEASLSRIARRIDLGRFIRFGRGEAVSGGADKPSILADALEAVLGAVMVDAGFSSADRVVGNLWRRGLERAARGGEFKDPKTRLQELMQDRERVTPNYRLTGHEGPDHERTFFAEVWADDRRLGRGDGRSKKLAEQAAAEAALTALGEDDD